MRRLRQFICSRCGRFGCLDLICHGVGMSEHRLEVKSAAADRIAADFAGILVQAALVRSGIVPGELIGEAMIERVQADEFPEGDPAL